jgi:hypothetical protein
LKKFGVDDGIRTRGPQGHNVTVMDTGPFALGRPRHPQVVLPLSRCPRRRAAQARPRSFKRAEARAGEGLHLDALRAPSLAETDKKRARPVRGYIDSPRR